MVPSKKQRMSFSKWAYLLAYCCNIWECLFQEVGEPELVLPTTHSYSYGEELVPCGHSSYHNCMNSWFWKLILSNLLMKFLAINIKLFGVLWQNKNKNLLVVYHQEVFVFIWITTRRFLFLFWSPLGGFCFYLNDSISYTLIWQFFCFSWKKLSKWRAKNGLNYLFFISKLLRMPLPESWKTRNGYANHSFIQL